MGKVTRKQYSGEFKSRVTLEAIRGEQALAELASKHGVHQTKIGPLLVDRDFLRDASVRLGVIRGGK